MSSSVFIDNKNKDISILGKGPKQGLGDTPLTAEVKYPINLTQLTKGLALSPHYDEIKSFLFVNVAKIYQFKAKNSEIKRLYTVLGGAVNFFSVDFNPIETNNILDIHKYLMKRTLWYKISYLGKYLLDYYLVWLMDVIIQIAFHWAIKNIWFNPLLLIYILMNGVKDFTTIHLWLN